MINTLRAQIRQGTRVRSERPGRISGAFFPVGEFGTVILTTPVGFSAANEFTTLHFTWEDFEAGDVVATDTTAPNLGPLVKPDEILLIGMRITCARCGHFEERTSMHRAIKTGWHTAIRGSTAEQLQWVCPTCARK